MDVMPGYRRAEIGLFPQDWEVDSFGKLFTFSNGVNADKNAYGKGLRFVNVLEPITYSHLHGPEIPGRVSLPKSVAEKYTVRTGDVLFNRTSETDVDLGLAAAYLGTEHVVFGGFVIRGRPTGDHLDPTYSGYALRAPAIRSQIIAMGQGAIRANIGQQNLKLVIAPIPPKPEQCAIATALSDVDALLGRLDRLIAKKRDLKQAAMQQLLTGQTRLPGFRGEWEVKELGQIGSISGAGVDKKIRLGEPPVLLVNYMDVYRRTFIRSKDLDHVVSASPDQAARCAVRKGDVFFTPSSEMPFDIAASAVAMEDIPDACYSYHVVRLRLDEDWDLSFRAYAFQTQAFLDQAARTSEGSGVRYVITQAKFRQLTIRYPSDKAEQAAIAAILSDMDAELATLEQRRDKTRDLKQGMMQELLTGKTRLIPAGAAYS